MKKELYSSTTIELLLKDMWPNLGRENMKKKIMIVDDEPDIRFTLEDDLEDDYEIITLNDGLDCIEALEQGKMPDLILLDIMMPGMNGWETFYKIREHESWSQIPVIFLTARTDNVAEDAGSFLGDDYIEKPYQIEDLKNRIQKAIEKKSQGAMFP